MAPRSPQHARRPSVHLLSSCLVVASFWGIRYAFVSPKRHELQRHVILRATSEPDKASNFQRVSETLMDEWQAEAQKCWAPDADGHIGGYLADLVPAGKEYNPLVRIYVDTDTKPQPQDSRPWRALDKESEVDTSDDDFVEDTRNEDYQSAMNYFGKAGNAPEQGGIVLDLACGTGYIGRRMARSGLFNAVLAADVDWRIIEAARVEAETRGVGPEDGFLLFRGDAQRLPFHENSVDYVWMGMGLHKVQDAQNALEAIARILKPGGRFMGTFIPGIKDWMAMAKTAGFSEVSLESQSSAARLEAVK